MTFIKRAVSLAIIAAAVASLAACSPIRVSDESAGCPAGHVQLDIHGTIEDVAGNEIEGRTFVLTVAAQSYDPEYQGIYVVGTGTLGRNPVVRDQATESDDPVLCVPAERAVAVMVRMSMPTPSVAYETIECALIHRGVDGIGALGQVALERREAQITDLMDGADPWIVAQCDYLYAPPGFTGPMPDLFPRPGSGER